jgi:hypothetical protein
MTHLIQSDSNTPNPKDSQRGVEDMMKKEDFVIREPKDVYFSETIQGCSTHARVPAKMWNMVNNRQGIESPFQDTARGLAYQTMRS